MSAPPALRCARGHSFDLARQGYVNLTTGRAPHSGDTGEMVAARVDFLGSGHYDFVSAGINRAALGAYPGGLVVDVGAGTGWHLARLLDDLPAAAGLAVDVSKPALRRAARAHPRAGAALCDVWDRLPLAGGRTGLLLNVFAPRNGAEFRRVLRDDGLLLVVTPADDHLTELVAALGLLRVDPDKADRLTGGLSPHFRLVSDEGHRRSLALGHADLRTLVGMGPNAWHTDVATLDERLGRLPEVVTVTASVRVTTWRPS